MTDLKTVREDMDREKCLKLINKLKKKVYTLRSSCLYKEEKILELEIERLWLDGQREKSERLQRRLDSERDELKRLLAESPGKNKYFFVYGDIDEEFNTEFLEVER